MHFAHYLALGDSMSIDLYPALDLGATDVAVALERETGAGSVAPVGAASLFHANAEEHWPEEVGNDLASRYPGIRFTSLATDAATIGDVFGEQLPAVEASDEPTLVTLTVGTYDLLSFAVHRPTASLRGAIVRDVTQGYDLLLDAILAARPNACILATTVFDPSDRTGRVPGAIRDESKLPLSMIDALNVHLREVAAARDAVTLADAYLHFLGHGVTAPEADRWYWRRSLLEPNARGASELRRVWLQAVDA